MNLDLEEIVKKIVNSTQNYGGATFGSIAKKTTLLVNKQTEGLINEYSGENLDEKLCNYIYDNLFFYDSSEEQWFFNNEINRTNLIRHFSIICMFLSDDRNRSECPEAYTWVRNHIDDPTYCSYADRKAFMILLA